MINILDILILIPLEFFIARYTLKYIDDNIQRPIMKFDLKDSFIVYVLYIVNITMVLIILI